MNYKIDHNNKIIFCSSPKAGTNHVKRLYLYYNNIEYDQKTFHSSDILPENIDEYKIILFIRNPYKRFVSGYIEKGIIKNHYNFLNRNILTFSDYVNFIYNNKDVLFYTRNKPYLIERQGDLIFHFAPQINNDTKKLKLDKVFDIENINYNYFDNIYENKINDEVKKQRGTHNNKYYSDIKEYFYNKPLLEYKDNIKIPTYEYFFNEDLKNKLYEIYKSDFEFFGNIGFNYDFELL